MPVTFTEASTATFPQPAAGGRMTFIDVDNDGDLDILYQTGANGTAFQYGRSNGDGSYTLFALASSPFAGLSLPDHNGGNYHVGDIDGDGDMDLWAGLPTGAGTGTFLRNDSGLFTVQSSATFPQPLASSRSLMADFDNDGDADILYQTGGNGTAFQYAESNGDGTYTLLGQGASPFAGVTLLNNGGGTHLAGDFDGDGDTDVYATAASATGSYYRNDGGTFTTQSSATFPAAAAITRYVVGDFDSDGDDDILYQTGADGSAWQFGRSNGDGTFSILAQADSPFAGLTLVNHNGSNFVAADVDGDGDDDLVGVTNGTTGEFYLANGKPPEIASSTPSDNGAGVAVGANITVTFDESVSKGSGNIYIVRASDGVVVETIAVGSAQVTGSGATWTIDPSITLAGMTGYAIRFDGGTFVDADGSIFSGIDDNTTINFTTAAANTAPAFTGLSGDTASFTEGSAVRLDAAGNATVADAEQANFNGGTLTVSITANEVAGQDALGVADIGAGPGEIGVSGSDISYQGVVIGTFTGGSGGADLVITLDGDATPAATQALVRALQYSNTSEAPNTTARTIQITLTDGVGGISATQSVTVNLASVNDQPSGVDNTVTLAEGGAHVFTAADFGFNDTDGGAFAGVVFTTLPAQGSLELTTGGVPTILAAGASVSAADIASGALRYLPTDPDANGTFFDTLTFQVRDDGGTTNSGVDTDQTPNTLTFDVTVVDDAPTAASDAVTVAESGLVSGSVFADNGSGADADVDGPALAVSEVNGSAASVGTEITLPSGALLTLNADGTYSYDPNGAFADLAGPGSGASNTSTTDSFTYTLAGGGAATVTITITGEEDPGDPLEGSAGADTLGRGPAGNGGTGANDMNGGDGSDIYFIDDGGDAITDTGGAGDRVLAGLDYTLTAGAGIEIMSTTDHAGVDPIDLTGNELANLIYGNAGDNRLDGGAGVDRLMGGLGDDVYIVDNAADRVDEAAGQGADTVRASVSYRLGAGQSVETLTTTDAAGTGAIHLTGNQMANAVTGNAGNNRLDGGEGADTLTGGLGDDIYVVDNAADVVVEADGAGLDRVLASADYVLAAGVSVETLSTTDHLGTAPLDLTGNEFSQLLYGNAGANVLEGMGGDDVLRGNGGADRLFGGAGTDVLYGDAGDDVLSGGEGNDQIFGGAADDTVLLTGDQADYQLIDLGGGRWRVADAVGGRDGVDILTGIETLEFGDGSTLVLGVAGALMPAGKEAAGAQALPGVLDGNGFLFELFEARQAFHPGQDGDLLQLHDGLDIIPGHHDWLF